MAKEIEMKFVMDRAWATTHRSELEKISFRKASLKRGYFDAQHDVGVITVDRLAGTGEGERFGMITSKTGAGLVRKETEIVIPWEAARAAYCSCEHRIGKVRYDVLVDGHHLEVDVFSGRHLGLVIGEIEFGSEEEASLFDPSSFPDHMLRLDVTNDPRFTNHRLACMSIDEIVALISGR
jgi:CYTH domain-containing protein